MRTTQPSRRNQAEPGRGQHASSRRAGQHTSGPSGGRQASVTAASLTAAERASLRAPQPANRASARLRVAPRQAAQPQAAQSRAAPSRAAPSRAAPSRAAPSRAVRLRSARASRTSGTSGAPPALRRTTGIVLTSGGAILWLAVHVTVAFVAIQRAGLVVLVTGLLWLWLPVPGKRDRLRQRFNQLMSFLEWDPASAESARCSLEDLLQPRSESSPDGPRE